MHRFKTMDSALALPEKIRCIYIQADISFKDVKESRNKIRILLTWKWSIEIIIPALSIADLVI